MLEPGKCPVHTTLSTSDYALRKAVNIGISNHYKYKCKRFDGDICILYNRRNIRSPLIPNRLIDGEILRGVIYVVGVTSKNELRSLTFEEFFKYFKRFFVPEEYPDAEATTTNLTYAYKVQIKKLPSKVVELKTRD